MVGLWAATGKSGWVEEMRCDDKYGESVGKDLLH